jgi:hypothetical protein
MKDLHVLSNHLSEVPVPVVQDLPVVDQVLLVAAVEQAGVVVNFLIST